MTVPQQPERPALASPIAIATELWLVVIAAMSVATIGSYPRLREVMVDYRDNLPKDASASVRESADLLTQSSVVITSLVLSVLLAAAVALVGMVFVRQGYNWARLLLSALSAYLVANGLLTFAGERAWTQVPQLIAAGCAGGALLLLMRRESDTYCREMAEFRAATKEPAVPPTGAWSQQPWQLPPQPPQGPPAPPQNPGGQA
ncbi:MAG: hypothetical protein QM728_12485 [Gordonia sp. (in: high G+C Gram-positive bacteria)]|uniref:hypothetical protein n=1 Tax=Gordonia sp. (in: high G+C Gram-positive bacteria) TaxID=84139 RepID=UPI0039E3E761